MAKRDNFGNSFGVLVAMAGSAIGLGNIWRFPYLVGENGGAAFIILYLISVFILCVPLMMSEFVIGRRSQKNAVSAFSTLAPGTKWSGVGLVGVIASFIILSFYSVVGGWSLDYLIRACMMDFSTGVDADFAARFNGFISDPVQPVICCFIFLLLTAWIVVRGVAGGIEKFSKIMMPVLFVLMILIAVRSMTMDGASSGIRYLFKPDFSKVTKDTVLAAVGQSFFSLSLGMGTIITYGSYVKKSENMMKCVSMTVLSDTLFAIIAGCAVMPAVFAFGISPSEGPGLVFVTLPYIFSNIPMGSVVAILFFLALLLAALTSSISLLEVVVSYTTEAHGVKRTKAVIVATLVLFALGVLCSLSFGLMSDFKIFGKTVFDLFDYVSSNIMMTLGAILITVFTGWKIKKDGFIDEVTNGGQLAVPKWLLNAIFYVIKYAAPLIILVILINSL